MRVEQQYIITIYYVLHRRQTVCLNVTDKVDWYLRLSVKLLNYGVLTLGCTCIGATFYRRMCTGKFGITLEGVLKVTRELDG